MATKEELQDFVGMVAALTMPGAVVCPECGGELAESRMIFKCADCGSRWPMSKVDEMRFDNAEDSHAVLKQLISEARRKI